MVAQILVSKALSLDPIFRYAGDDPLMCEAGMSRSLPRRGRNGNLCDD